MVCLVLYVYVNVQEMERQAANKLPSIRTPRLAKSAGPFRGIPAVEVRTCLLSHVCCLLFCLSTSQLFC